MDRMWTNGKETGLRLGVSKQTLRRWALKGYINRKQTLGGHWRYDISSYNSKINTITNTNRWTTNLSNHRTEDQEEPEQKKHAVYCRVSSYKQKEDLERQVQQMQEIFPKAKVFKDIGSGLNYKRKGLQRLLVECQKGNIQEVVVAHKDRLARFGAEIYEWVIRQAGGNVRYLSQGVRSAEQEITEDILAILHVFSCRQNGKRRYAKSNKKGNNGQEQGVQRVHNGPAERGQEKRVR